MPTFCRRCTHVHTDSMRLQPWYWLCMMHPRLNEGFGFVTETIWDKAPPYLRCVDVNGGACPLYEERNADTNNSDA